MHMLDWDFSLAVRVNAAVNAVVPGCSLRIPSADPSTWVISFPNGTSQQLQDAAYAALMAFDETTRRAAEVTRRDSFTNDSGRIDLLDRLRTASAAQIDTWVETNVTTLAAARAVLKAIIKVIALDARH